MGIDYKAVGGYGYQFDYDCLLLYIKNKLIKEGVCVDNFDVLDFLDEYLPDGFYGAVYGNYFCDEGLGVCILSENNDIYRDFYPLFIWLSSFSIEVENPRIICELLVF